MYYTYRYEYDMILYCTGMISYHMIPIIPWIPSMISYTFGTYLR